MKTKTLLIALLHLVTLTLQAQTTLPPQGHKLVWRDEFNGDALDEKAWNVEVNGDGGGNQELQYYRRQNVQVRDGNLVITARRENYNGRAFTSGRVNTREKVAIKHGTLQARIKFPKTANGLWPAYWMMGNDYGKVGWPRCGEMDIVELGHANGIKNGTQDRYFMGTLHYGPSASNTDHQQQSQDITVASDKAICDGNYHVLTVEWDDNNIHMYYDLAGYTDAQKKAARYATFNVRSSDNDYAMGKYFQKEFFFIFNLAVGGQFTGIYNASGITALPKVGDEAEMLIDWVRVFQKEEDKNRIYITPDGTNKPKDDDGDEKFDEDIDTEVGRFGSKALDDKGESTFSIDSAYNVITIGTSYGVTQALSEKIIADYNVDDQRNFLWVWSGTYQPQPSQGVNSFGYGDPYNHYVVTNVGWSGLGYASNEGAGKDLSILNDDYVLHFAMRGTDPERHASHQIIVGDAKFTLGKTTFEGAPILGDFRRDGTWTNFDIPVKALRALIGGAELYSSNVKNYAGNVFAILSGGAQGTDLQFDNVFFYQTTKGTPGVPTTDTTTQLGQYGQKSLVDGQSTFDFSDASDAVLIATSGGVTEALSGVTLANYNVDNKTHFLYVWDGGCYTTLPSTGANSFGWAEDHVRMSVGDGAWNGAGYAAVAPGKDLSMIDNTYYLHFALKGSDVLTHASQTFIVGAARFIIGSETDGTPILGDYRRDGEWYSFDIPVAKLAALSGGALFAPANAYVDNAFAFMTTNIKGNEINLDNVFFYRKKSDKGGEVELPSFVSKSLDASGKSTFHFEDVTAAVLIGTSQGVTQALKDCTVADYNVDDRTHFFYNWDDSYTSNTSQGVNSFGWAEAYTDLMVANVGWSGAGYASEAPGKDLSMIDDSYYLHFALKGTHHETHRISIGKAAFAIGDQSFVDNGVATPPLADYVRDGEWYSFDIPFSEIRQRASVVFPSADHFVDNVFAILSGGKEGTRVQLDNIFFYQCDDEATHIGTAPAARPANPVRYNLQGQRVGSDYRGIVVVNGRKVLM